MSNTNFIDNDIFHQNRTIAKIILCDPDEQFHSKKCKYSQSCSSRFASTCTAPAVELLLFELLEDSTSQKSQQGFYVESSVMLNPVADDRP